MKFIVKKTIDSLGRIVIPKNIREYYNILLGDELSLIPVEDGILIVKRKSKSESQAEAKPWG